MNIRLVVVNYIQILRSERDFCETKLVYHSAHPFLYVFDFCFCIGGVCPQRIYRNFHSRATHGDHEYVR